MSTLYELTGEMLELYNMADDPEADEEVLRCIADTMEGVGYEFDLKLEGYAAVIRNLEADVKAIKEEEQRLAGRRRTIERNIDRLKASIMEAMKAVGKTKAGGSIFTVSIAKNGGKAPLIVKEGFSAEDIPDKYRKVTVDFDKDAIRSALEGGEALYFAEIGERGESVRIK